MGESNGEIRADKTNAEVNGNSGEAAVPVSVVVAQQFINLDQAAKDIQIGGNTVGQNVLHEIMEAYHGAKDMPG